MSGVDLNNLQVDDKLKDALFALENKMIEDYCHFTETFDTVEREKFRQAYVDGIAYEKGHKYLKVINNDLMSGGATVHSFINLANKNFQYGDILKADGWKKPAVNKARGNIFEKFMITWTGALYLTARNTRCVS
tara:strand:- start:232 stop:633 length:402 start_codon:yes stop_codon:yes gene_type:complete